MEKEFWKQAWIDGKTRFHQSEINPHLKKHFPKLGVKKHSNIFVPLCGKSKDMLWLIEQGYHVTGVEVSNLAVDDFFNEAGLDFNISHTEGFKVYSGEHIDIWCGDFFALDPKKLPKFKGLYDRASLIALPKEMRKKYYLKMNELVPSHVKGLLITLNYSNELMEGPPFSVDTTEIENNLNQFEVELLESHAFDAEEKFQKSEIGTMHENVYLINHK